jgi:hypothetical protein
MSLTDEFEPIFLVEPERRQVRGAHLKTAFFRPTIRRSASPVPKKT